VHSRYQRRIYDQAVGGRRTVIDLTMRRFFCDSSGCAKTTFAEQVTGLTARHARHSVAARQALTRIAVAVGGRAGQRLTGHLALPTGRMTLLRLIRALPEPAMATPRVLGVDLSRSWDYPAGVGSGAWELVVVPWFRGSKASPWSG
jgi:hypothetical protein